MNSANRLVKNRTTKIQNDQKPRQLARNSCQRRRLMPVNHLPRRGSLVIARIASDLPRLEIDAGIDQRVENVAQKIGEETEEPENIEGGEEHRIVAIDRRAPAEKT